MREVDEAGEIAGKLQLEKLFAGPGDGPGDVLARAPGAEREVWRARLGETGSPRH